MNHIVWLLAFFVITNANQQCKPVAYSSRGNYLKGHVISSGNTTHIGECFSKCSREPRCKSINFRFKDLGCELNDASRYTHPWDYGFREEDAYNDYPYQTAQYGYCADIKDVNKEAKSGNYWITVKDKMVLVYCDMDNHGVFRVDVLKSSKNFSVFYGIPRGAKHFNSACTGGNRGSCPRIIISYSYPYQWESNCKGIDKGYLIANTCYMFDGYDNNECGYRFYSSKYHTDCVLYGYCISNGIHHNQQGRLFVK